MAYGSYAPVYTSVEMILIEQNERTALEVLRAIAWHADPKGVAFPGVRRLMTVTHRGFKTITREIARLDEWNLIRVHEFYNPMKGRNEIVYQLNPMALYIREEIEIEAWALWDKHPKGKSRELLGVFKNASSVLKNEVGVLGVRGNHAQPENQTQNQKQIQIQNPESDPQRSLKLSEGVFLGFSANGHSPNGYGQNRNTVTTRNPNPQRVAQSAQYHDSDNTESQQRAAHETDSRPPRSVVPPPRKDYTKPLSEPADEDLAQYLNTYLPTRIEQARGLVDTFGVQHIEAGLRWLDEERQRSYVRKPAGRLIAWLRDHKTEPTLFAGKYADFIDR